MILGRSGLVFCTQEVSLRTLPLANGCKFWYIICWADPAGCSSLNGMMLVTQDLFPPSCTLEPLPKLLQIYILLLSGTSSQSETSEWHQTKRRAVGTVRMGSCETERIRGEERGSQGLQFDYLGGGWPHAPGQGRCVLGWDGTAFTLGHAVSAVLVKHLGGHVKQAVRRESAIKETGGNWSCQNQ